MDGWVKVHRKIWDNKIWTSEPFTRGQAWIDLLLLANHEYGYFYLRDHKVEVERGQVGWSQLKLATRWKWSRTKVRKFLNDLEKEQQIKQQQSHTTSIITILNYEEYQQKEQQDIQQQDNRKTTERQQKNTNKKNKEELRNREEFLEYSISDKDKSKETKVVKEKAKKNDYIGELIEIFQSAYEEVRGEVYEITNKGKERSAASNILKLFKERNPDLDSEQTKEGLYKFFKLACNINDDWLYANMTLPMLYSKINNVITILKNGKANKKPDLSKGESTISDAFKRGLVERMLASEHSPDMSEGE